MELNSSPALSRSPAPSQQILAGRPWKAMRSGAIRIQRCRLSFSGNNRLTASSVAWMSAGITGQRRPAEGPAARAEQWTDIGRHEPGEVEGAGVPGQLGLAANGIAVVEDLGAGVLETDHGLDVGGHRAAAPDR